jgi:hypothetical protein
MATEWDDWLRKLAADGKGGLGLKGRPQMRAIDRGLAYEYVIAVGADVSADTFTASLRASPDGDGATLADFTITVGSYADGVTPITLELTDDETAALPIDANADGLETMVFDILWTPNGGTEQRFMGGIIQVSGKVTDGSGS